MFVGYHLEKGLDHVQAPNCDSSSSGRPYYKITL